MSKNTVEKLNIGIVGARRGGSFYSAIEANGARVHAVCDLDADVLAEVQKRLEDVECYTSYEEMLNASNLDAVVVSTPMHLHAPQSIQALEKGLHVLSEVTAAVSVAQCCDLVAACKASKGVYMMAENVNYTRPNVLVKTLVDQGLFGEVYYAEGEYLHELKDLNERTPWRRVWQTGVRGITYGTHPLGPVLNWMTGDRIVRVCCEGSGHHYADPDGKPYHDDTSVMLAKTARGALIKVRVDMISERPHVTCTYQLQGTGGAYESARHRDGVHRIWLQDLCGDKQSWRDLGELEPDYLPEIWRAPSEQALKAGHGGSDYYVIQDFIRLIDGGEPWCRIDIHGAMDMTLPGLMSQASIEREGEWVAVPDTRAW